MKSFSFSGPAACTAFWCSLLLAIGLSVAAPGHATPAAPTPPMGWNSFNAYGGPGAAINLLNVADTLSSPANRLQQFKYLVVDDGWAHARVSRTRTIRGQSMAVEDIDPWIRWITSDARTGAEDGAAVNKLKTAGLLPASFDATKPEDRAIFMKAIAAYLHSKGLKFGLYGSQTLETCFRYPVGSLGHELEDASLLASWDVDFVKLDDCTYDIQDTANWKKLIDLLREFNPAIVVSLSNQGMNKVALASPAITECITGKAVAADTRVPPKEWSRQVGADMWRADGDLLPDWGNIVRGFATLTQYKPHCSNAADGRTDGDFLAAGTLAYWGPPGPQRFLSLAETRTQLSTWAVLNSPLIGGFVVEDRDSSDPHRQHVFLDGMSLLANPTITYVDQTLVAGAGAVELTVPGHEQKCNIDADQGLRYELPCVIGLARWLIKPDCKSGKVGEYAVSLTNMTDSPRNVVMPLFMIEAALTGAAGACDGERSSIHAWGNSEMQSAFGSNLAQGRYTADQSGVFGVLGARDSMLVRIVMKSGPTRVEYAPTTVQNQTTGLCIEVKADGTLMQSTCTGGRSQLFHFDYFNPTRMFGVDWTMRTVAGDPKLLAIDVANTGAAIGTPVTWRNGPTGGLAAWSTDNPAIPGAISTRGRCLGALPNPDGSANATLGAPLVLMDCAAAGTAWKR